MRVDVLNYPYIRVRSVDWLKRTLLIFPHVVRMTPEIGAPTDDPEILAFTSIMNGRYPSLRAAALHSEHVHHAQLSLILELRSRLDQDRNGFLVRYGREAAASLNASLTGQNLTLWERRLSARATFQIHRYKLFDELTAFLSTEKLAWPPDMSTAEGPDYLEMHPGLGEAVMATLATACAENEGLEVVTEFPRLHSKLIGVPRERILTACLEGIEPSGATSVQQIAEFFVYRRCNVDMLSAENIVSLKDERQALSDFCAALEDLASSLPRIIHSRRALYEQIEDSLNDMFKVWESEI